MRKFQQNPRFEAAPLNDEAILFDPVTSNFLMLNRTSSFIWHELAEPGSAESLAALVCASFGNVEPVDALTDVKIALEQMLKLELVTTSD